MDRSAGSCLACAHPDTEGKGADPTMTDQPRNRPPLERTDLDDDPLAQFDRWFGDARERAAVAMPEATCLSTVDDDGYPDARMVLLKARDARGFVFYTNLRSRKGRSLAERPRAALTFYWESLGRQIRIQGDVEPVSDEEADAYFRSRPEGSRIGAWASDQSRVLDSRATLESRVREVETRHADGEVPRPPHWSGLRIVPTRIEFWQEGAYRLHDRFLYRRADGGGWTVERLYP